MGAKFPFRLYANNKPFRHLLRLKWDYKPISKRFVLWFTEFIPLLGYDLVPLINSVFFGVF
jgi:hypothetical protein